MVKPADMYVEEKDIHSLILSPYGLITNYKKKNQVLHLVEVTLCKRQKTGQPSWHMSLFPVLRSQGQGLQCEFQASKGYIVRPCLKL